MNMTVILPPGRPSPADQPSTGGRPSDSPRPSTSAPRQAPVARPGDWSRATDCPAWDVRALAAHDLGQAELAGSLLEFVRQFVAVSRRAETGVDALTAHQVEARRALTPADIVARYSRVMARAVRGRRRRSTPGRQADPSSAAGDQRHGGVVDLRLPFRDHPDPGHLDAPGRHGPGHWAADSPHRGARRGAGGRRGDGMGRAARCAVHLAADRTRRWSLEGRRRRGGAVSRRRAVRPDAVGASCQETDG